MTEFDVALVGRSCWLELATGERIALPVERWRSTPEPSDEMMLAHCSGPTLDIGCGPGRLASALANRGVPVLGVDVSPVAIRLTLARGAIAVRRNVFGPLPGEGRWTSVLLADGNVGIGGNPVRLLRRIRQLLSPAGKVLAEVEAPGSGVRHRPVRLNGKGNWFPWAWLGADAVAETAAAASFEVRWLAEDGGRWFTELVPSCRRKTSEMPEPHDDGRGYPSRAARLYRLGGSEPGADLPENSAGPTLPSGSESSSS